MAIHYIKGNVKNPKGNGMKIICYICNDEDTCNTKFDSTLSTHYSMPELMYKKSIPINRLGEVQMKVIKKDIIVANMIAQHGVIYDEFGLPPIRYNALRNCLITVNDLAIQFNATLHTQKKDYELAGGQWKNIEKIINDVVNVNTYVYNLE
jgi:hypothetical protein